MFGLSEYVLAARGGSWPADEALVLDTVRAEAVALVREEPWPEVLERPWPDGVQGRPWLHRLLGVDRNPRQSRTVVRRLDDGCPLVRLHRRQPLFFKTVGIFDREDHRLGYCRWAFKGAGPRDEFAVVRVDHRQLAEVRRTGEGVYRVVEASGGTGWATVTVSRKGVDPETSAACRVSLHEAAFDREKDGIFLLAATLMLFLSEREVRRTMRCT